MTLQVDLTPEHSSLEQYGLIADTFTASLARLTNAEQKVVKTTAFDLQLNPANPGMESAQAGQGAR